MDSNENSCPGVEIDNLIKRAIQSSLVIDLINGNIVSETVVNSYLKVIRLQVCPNNVFVVNVDDLDSKQLIDDKKNRFARVAMLKTMREIVDEKMGIVSMEGRGSIIAILPVNTEIDIYEQFKNAQNIGQELLNKFNDETGLSATVGIGRAYSNFLDIPKSYNEAKKAIKHKFFLGSHNAIHINDIMDFDENVLECFLGKESELTAKVRIGDEEGSLNVLKELLNDIFKQNGIYPDMLKVRILELLTIISRAAIDGGADSRTLLELKVKYGDEIANIENQERFEEWISKAFSEIIAHVKVNQQIDAIKAIRVAQNYIDQNFSKQLTLESAADYVHLSVYYFSHMFKREIGMTFVEYLTEKRIKKAQQLLLTTDMSVSDISKEVGYWDSNYFGKVFKNIIGITPSQCRKGQN